MNQDFGDNTPVKLVTTKPDAEVALARQVRGNNIVKGKAGPFCSRRCSGTYNQQIQAKGRLAQLAEATDLNPVK